MVDQAAVAARLEVDAAFVVRTGVRLVEEVAVADDQSVLVAQHDPHGAGVSMPARRVEHAVLQIRPPDRHQKRMRRCIVREVVVTEDTVDGDIVPSEEKATGTLEHLTVADHQHGCCRAADAEPA